MKTLQKGTGAIPRQDFELLFENLGEKLSQEEISGLLDDADRDGEGFINYAEFCSIKNLWKNSITLSIFLSPGVKSQIWISICWSLQPASQSNEYLMKTRKIVQTFLRVFDLIRLMTSNMINIALFTVLRSRGNLNSNSKASSSDVQQIFGARKMDLSNFSKLSSEEYSSFMVSHLSQIKYFLIVLEII